MAKEDISATGPKHGGVGEMHTRELVELGINVGGLTPEVIHTIHTALTSGLPTDKWSNALSNPLIPDQALIEIVWRGPSKV